MNSMGTRRRSVSMYGTVTALGSLSALLVGLALFDDRLRAEFARIANGRAPAGEIATFGGQVRDTLSIVMLAIQDQSVANAPLVIFGIAAVILVLFMTRT
jgi:hypothetical protein